MAKSRKQKVADRKRTQRREARQRDERKKAELQTSKVLAAPGDGLALAPQARRQRTATSPTKAQAPRPVANGHTAETWVSKTRRALDILASGGTAVLFEPKPGKQR